MTPRRHLAAAVVTFTTLAGSGLDGQAGPAPTVVAGARVVTVCPVVVATADDVVRAGAVVDVDVPPDAVGESFPPQAARVTANAARQGPM